MHHDEDRERSGAVGRVDAYGDVAVDRGNGPILDRFDIRPGRGAHFRAQRSDDVDPELVHRGTAADPFDERLCVSINWHCRPPVSRSVCPAPGRFEPGAICRTIMLHISASVNTIS